MSHSFDATTGREVQTLELDHETSLVVGDGDLVTATSVRLHFTLADDGDGVTAVALETTMMRSQVGKLLSAGIDLGVTTVELASKFKPFVPIELSWDANDDMVEAMDRARRGPGMSLSQLVTSRDKAHPYAAVLTLSNYRLRTLYQPAKPS